MQGRRLRPAVSPLEGVFLVLALACLAGEIVLVSGPDSLSRRLLAILLSAGAVGLGLAACLSILRRSRSRARPPAD